MDALPELAALRGKVGWGPGTEFGVLVAAGRDARVLGGTRIHFEPLRHADDVGCGAR